MCEKAVPSLEKDAHDVPELIIPSNILCDLLNRAEKIQQKDDRKEEAKNLARVERERVLNETRRREAELSRQATTPKRMVESVVKAISPRKSTRIQDMMKRPSYRV